MNTDKSKYYRSMVGEELEGESFFSPRSGTGYLHRANPISLDNRYTGVYTIYNDMTTKDTDGESKAHPKMSPPYCACEEPRIVSVAVFGGLAFDWCKQCEQPMTPGEPPFESDVL